MPASAETEAEIAAWLAAQKDAMLAMLAEMVNIDSGSYNKAGVDRTGEVVRRFLAGHGIAVETIPGRNQGDCLRAAVPMKGASAASGGNVGGNIMLLGHRDTVFPDGEAGRRPFTINGDIATGPGCADMKAGIVMNCFVLAAFHKFGAAPAPMVGLFTGDEEIGSPEGRPVIEAEARKARIVFNSEPGRPTGNVVTGRKGGVFMVMTVEGKAAHSGGNFTDGISAIGELAHKITAIHALTDLKAGTTLNVGLVKGGQSVNTVAPWAEGQIDLRYVNPADRDTLVSTIEGIVRKAFVPGTKSSFAIKGEFLPLAQSAASARVFELYRDAAADSGLKVEGEFSGGCADSGFTAGVGTPTICAVGPVGGKAHSPEEFLRVDTIVPRAQAMARAVLRLEQAGV
ncbi:MAG: M20 family metallopeptidase [Alphaproteobacteria bacterium]|nr:M20 family metallopeptidase [Alphaproteobacteria bacterium]